MAATRALLPDARSRTIRGRVVAAESGTGLPGCQILVAGAERTRSDADGAFVVDVRGDERRTTVEIHAPGRVAVSRDCPATGGGVTELGAVTLRRGAAITGALRTQDGHPLPDGWIRLLPAQAALRTDGFCERWVGRAQTAPDGAFRLPTLLPAGIAEIVVEGAPALVGAPYVVLDEGRHHHLSLVCRPFRASDCIAGTVRDTAGRPAARVLVQAFAAPDGGGSVAAARTGDDGRFRLFRGREAPASVWLSASPSDSTPGMRHPRTVPWGTTDLALELSASVGVWLQVTDASSGAAIEDFAVQCVPTAGVRSVAAGQRRAVGRHPGGRVWLDGVPPGPNALIVWPDDPRWLPSLPQAFDCDDTGSVVSVALARAVACPVRVVRTDGESMGGVTVELLLPAPGNQVRDLERLFEHGGSRAPTNVRLASAVTDANGNATLRWFADPQPLELRLHGPGMVPQTETGVRLGPGGVVVRVAPASWLRVRLAGAGGARLVLREVGGLRRLPLDAARPYQLDDTGSLVADVPAGRWNLHLQRSWSVDGRSTGAWCTSPDPFATLELRAGGRHEFAADLRPAFAECEISGTAFVDGQPATHIVLLCGEASSDEAARVVHSVVGQVDTSGRFRFAGLPAGHYALQLRVACNGQQVAVPLGDWRSCAPGESQDRGCLSVATVPVRIRVQAGDGEVVAGVRLELLAAAGLALAVTLDERGEAHLDHVPTASYRLRLRHPDGGRELGMLQVAGPAAVAHVAIVR